MRRKTLCQWLPAIIVPALLLGACGRAGQVAQQPSAAPLAPLPPTPEVGTATPSTRPTPRIVWPTPDETQRAVTAIIGRIETNAALFQQTVGAIDTATAVREAWQQTPAPTIFPPQNAPRLRDIWPASPQQTSAPTRLYLRSPSYSEFDKHTFWEVSLPGMQLRRLPAVEKAGTDRAAVVSPDGRLLAYVNSDPQDLRVLDLATGSDLGLGMAEPVSQNLLRCKRSLAWSPDSRCLAVLAKVQQGSKWLNQILLYTPRKGAQPRPLIQLPGSLQLLGWLDAQRLLAIHRNGKRDQPARLVAIDQQGGLATLHTIEPEMPSCTNLSPDRRNLIYQQNGRTRRLQLDNGEEQPFFPWTEQLFWVGDGRTLLVSPFTQGRTLWLAPLEQPEQQRYLLVSPPYQLPFAFGITGVSPDGRLLVACEVPVAGGQRIDGWVSHTWLYNIAADRWTRIHTNPSPVCDVVAGWSTLGGMQ